MTGRPPKIKGKHIVAVSLDKELIEWLDEYRQTDIGEVSRPEVIRHLLFKRMKEGSD